MIISGKQIQDVLKVYTEQNKTAKSAKAPKTGPVQQKDEVVLSSKAQEFSQIYQAIKAMPEVREERVKELADKINAGNYRVDAKDVAEKMIGRIMADRLK